MLRKIAFTLAAAGALAAFPAAAEAQPRGNAYGYWNNSAHARGYDRNDRYERRADRYDRRYDRDARYDPRYDDRYASRSGDRYDSRRYDDRYDRDGRRCSGTTGTIVGGAAGALAGREVAGRGDRTVGAVIGGVLGAVAGRAIDRSDC